MRAARTIVDYDSADGRLRLHAEVCGSKGAPRCVLCLHGLTRNLRDFDALVEHLSPRYRVATADQRGRGGSAWDSESANYQIGVYAKDMLGLLDRLGFERVVLIGTSMGGFISMLIGATQPHRVQGIVLNDIGPEVPPAGMRRLRESLTAPAEIRSWTDAETHTVRINGHAFPDYGPNDWAAFARRLYREDGTGRPVPAYDPAILDGLKQPTDADAVTPTFWPLWPQLKPIPMLAIRGELSDILSAATLQLMAARHPQLQTLTLHGRGHAPMLDEPAAVAAIDAFLERLPP